MGLALPHFPTTFIKLNVKLKTVVELVTSKNSGLPVCENLFNKENLKIAAK